MTEEAVVQEQDAPVQQEEQNPQIEVKETQEQPKRDVDHNWAQARELLQMQKQRIEELEAKMAQNIAPPKPEPDEFAEFDPDEYLTVAKARSMAEKLATKKAGEEARKVVGEYIQQQTVQSDEQRMRSKHEDYDYVVENFAVPLIKNDPALAHKVLTSKNPAETAYKLGKISDTYEEQAMKQQTSPKAERVLKNASRPVSGNAVSTGLKKTADDYSKLSPQDVWKMSQEYARKG